MTLALSDAAQWPHWYPSGTQISHDATREWSMRCAAAGSVRARMEGSHTSARSPFVQYNGVMTRLRERGLPEIREAAFKQCVGWACSRARARVIPRMLTRVRPGTARCEDGIAFQQRRLAMGEAQRPRWAASGEAGPILQHSALYGVLPCAVSLFWRRRLLALQEEVAYNVSEPEIYHETTSAVEAAEAALQAAYEALDELKVDFLRTNTGWPPPAPPPPPLPVYERLGDVPVGSMLSDSDIAAGIGRPVFTLSAAATAELAELFEAEGGHIHVFDDPSAAPLLEEPAAAPSPVPALAVQPPQFSEEERAAAFDFLFGAFTSKEDAISRLRYIAQMYEEDAIDAPPDGSRGAAAAAAAGGPYGQPWVGPEPPPLSPRAVELTDEQIAIELRNREMIISQREVRARDTTVRAGRMC
jgi:hypothetical protein